MIVNGSSNDDLSFHVFDFYFFEQQKTHETNRHTESLYIMYYYERVVVFDLTDSVQLRHLNCCALVTNTRALYLALRFVCCKIFFRINMRKM